MRFVCLIVYIGPRLVKRARPDIFRKFAGTIENADEVVASYIYHCNAQNPRY